MSVSSKSFAFPRIPMEYSRSTRSTRSQRYNDRVLFPQRLLYDFVSAYNPLPFSSASISLRQLCTR